MKILSLHCDFIKYKPLKKALREPEKLSKEREGEIEVKNPLVILTAIEKQDEQNPLIIQQLVKEVKDLAKQVNAKDIVLYPFRFKQCIHALCILHNKSVIHIRFFINIAVEHSFVENIIIGQSGCIIETVENFRTCKNLSCLRKINPE